MTNIIRAVYEGGVLQVAQPLALPEGQAVEVTVTAIPSATPPAPVSEEEMIRRIHASKSIQEWLELTRLLPPDDGGYDIVKALDENRRWSGECSLLPDAEETP